MGQADFAVRTQARMIARRNTFGTTFRVIRTTETAKGIEDLMALNDFPEIKLEYDGLSANELNPAVLDCIPADLDLKVGDYITYPYTTGMGEGVNRMRVSTLQPVMLSDVEVRRFILIYNAPTG